MITLKSEREIALMRQAGHIVAQAHAVIKDMIQPGISTAQIDEAVEKVIVDHGAIPSFKGYGGFPGSACTSINEEVVHGIPSTQRQLKEGDIIKVDIGAYYQGYHGDSAWTYPVGRISPEWQTLLDVTEASLFKGLEFARENQRLSDISNAIQTHAEAHGFSVVREFVGHGIGKQLHEDPQIPNYGPPGKGPRLKAGMTLAIEPMINLGAKEVRVLEDQWTAISVDHSASAHFEHTILITADGYDILTRLKEA